MPLNFTHDPVDDTITLHTPDGDVSIGAAGGDPIKVVKQLALNWHDQEAKRLHAEIGEYERWVVTVGVIHGEHVCLIMDHDRLAVAVTLNKRDALIAALDKFMQQD